MKKLIFACILVFAAFNTYAVKDKQPKLEPGLYAEMERQNLIEIRI